MDNLINRRETIYSKGFDIYSGGREVELRSIGNDFKKIKVGVKTLDDAVLELGQIRSSIPRNLPFCDKRALMRALIENDTVTLRAFSNFFYKTSGIYKRLCDYAAQLYRFDWYVAPEIFDDSVKEEKILRDFSKILNYLDSSYLKKLCGEIALTVVKDGCYYGYLVPSNDAIILQQLPPEYCRTRYSVMGMPAIEFNMQFFDTFKDIKYRMKVLNLFPDEFKKGYILYQQRRLQPDYNGDVGGWYLLTPGQAIKFSMSSGGVGDIPLFISTIPAILDLDAAQDLDRRKQMQKLLKIVIQKLPLDKNGDLIFDVDEARDIHNNAVAMLRRAIGVDVLTTFADVESIDMSDKNTSTTTDDLEKVERAVYNASGVAHNLFNSDGNIALEKSILNDESTLRNLLLQFEVFFDKIIQSRNTNRRKYAFKFYMLETTQYNYQALSKLYKEQAQLGYSKMLPQIALGHSQSFILNTAHFENEILHLATLMMPNLMSSTMNLEDLMGKTQQTNQSNTQKSTGEQNNSSSSSGRPEKPDDEKSDKTIQNKESMS